MWCDRIFSLLIVDDDTCDHAAVARSGKALSEASQLRRHIHIQAVFVQNNV